MRITKARIEEILKNGFELTHSEIESLCVLALREISREDEVTAREKFRKMVDDDLEKYPLCKG